ncbi:MAG: hypothetical protein FWC00_02785 [Firmicutes bacterium]|nr:hypothetical protein [Bacillota bacterium]
MKDKKAQNDADRVLGAGTLFLPSMLLAIKESNRNIERIREEIGALISDTEGFINMLRTLSANLSDYAPERLADIFAPYGLVVVGTVAGGIVLGPLITKLRFFAREKQICKEALDGGIHVTDAENLFLENAKTMTAKDAYLGTKEELGL